MTFEERKAQVRSYLGKTVKIEIDRPIGYVHHKEKYDLVYPINYGYIPGVLGGDGEELDVYLLGVDEPVKEYTAKIIGIVHRRDDVEDKLVAAPEGKTYTKEEIERAVNFQEKYHDSALETGGKEEMLVDMHAHTSGISRCAKKDFAGMIEEAKSVGIGGFVLCNHYARRELEAREIGLDEFNKMYTEEFRRAKEYADAHAFRIFFGIEVTMDFCQAVHMLIYGVDDEFHSRTKKPLFEMNSKELYETVKSAGGILSQGHPLRKGNNVLVDPRYIDAVELSSHIKYDGPHTDFLCGFAHEHGLFVTSGGDYHADTRRTYCGIYMPDGITDSKGIKDFLLSAKEYDVALEDTPSRITFVK